MFASLILFLVVAGAGFFFWQLKKEKKRAAEGQSRLATWRLLLATAFGLIALFSGGCSLLFLPTAVSGDAYVPVGLVLVIGVLPCALAVLFWWLSLKRGKG